MSESFNWESIELPEGIDYDQLYDQLIADPEMLDQLVKEYLDKDQRWLENEKKLQELRQKNRDNIRKTRENYQRFDQLMEEMNKSIITAKTTTITETLYYDNEFTYYSDPIQRVIDINELRQRMTKLDVCQPSTSGLNLRNETENIKYEDKSELTQTEDDEIIELSIIEGDNKSDIKRSYIPFIRHQPRVGDKVFAASNAILTHCWKPAVITNIMNYLNVSVKFEDRLIVGGNLLSHRMIAYNKPTNDPIKIGERVVAYLDESNSFQIKRDLYSGTVAEPAKNTNEFRYLIFFDKHAYRYVKREDIFYIYDKMSAEKIFSENNTILDDDIFEYLEFLKSYFKNYPERPMLRLQTGDDRIKVRYRGRWESAKVIEVDASLVLICFEKLPNPHSDWIYRGSRRLYDIHKEYQTTRSNVKHRAGRSTTRMTRRTDDRAYVEWNTADDDKEDERESKSDDEIIILTKEEVNRKRKVKQTARKSTAKPSMLSASSNATNMISTLLGDPMEIDVEQLPNLIAVIPKGFVPNHRCSLECINAEAESQTFYDQNPFYIPINVGYRREIIRTNNERKTHIVYRAPCGRRLRDIFEIYNYLRITDSMLDIDLFTFSTGFSLFRSSNPLKAYFYVEDITNGTERQPISCVNTIDSTDLGPVVYKADRFPHPDVFFSPDPDFLSCCDCTDNCQNSEYCSCQQLTLEASDAVRLSKHQVFGYEFKRLNEFVMTGVFECNQKCACNERCANRVVQNGIKCRLQLFKTLKKGWGVRVLHDVPKGTFLCIYAAQILNEDAADKEGKTFGDEYLADLDYIDVCEHQKEGYESDVELSDEDYKESSDSLDDDDDENDDDYKGPSNHKRGRSTTSYDFDVDGKNIISNRRKEEKSKKSYCLREDFFREDFCYSLDAKKMGNIGRYLNHSCEPNCFVQNVFVDTHDLRFPWVSFFAKKDILAYEELSWDYNYEIGSIDGRKMYCYCGAHRCRKRLL